MGEDSKLLFGYITVTRRKEAVVKISVARINGRRSLSIISKNRCL